MTLVQRNIMLGIGFLALLWLSYEFSFSKTIQVKKNYSELKKESEIFSNISQKLLTLKQQDKYYDSILTSKKISFETSFQNNLLSTINSFADSSNITVISFDQPHLFDLDNTITSTYSFSVKGSFEKITRLLFKLEQEYKLGKIVSVNYSKKKNYRRNSVYLECRILLQQITQK